MYASKEKRIQKKEKQILISLIASTLVLGVYCIYIYDKYLSANPDLINNYKFWGKALLILIPISIAGQIIVQIVFTIFNKILTNEEPSTIKDERDKLIELKAIRIAHWTFISGFWLAMFSLAFGMPPSIMFLLLLFSGYGASIIADIAKIYFYRKGF